MLDVLTSVHCGFSVVGDRGQARCGRAARFRDIPNGMPGLAARLPTVFSEGVAKERIDLTDFVALTATNPARLFGLAPRKGMIAIGADADLVLRDATKRERITNALTRHGLDNTPYEKV